MNGVDAVLAKYPWIDTDRLGVTGGSYGGYMTNWIVGHTNRFKAAVTLRSISNFISDDGTRDGAYGHADDFGGDIFEKLRSLLERVAAEVREEREDADAGPALGQRLPRADRAGRAVVPRAAALRRAERDRVLPAREPQPHAHRRAEAPRREHQLAGLLVRPVPERQRCGRSAGRAGTAKRQRHTGALTGLLTFVIEELSCSTIWESQALRVAGVLWSISDIDATCRVEMVTIDEQHAKSR